jgi:hypothetical protein
LLGRSGEIHMLECAIEERAHDARQGTVSSRSHNRAVAGGVKVTGSMITCREFQSAFITVVRLTHLKSRKSRNSLSFIRCGGSASQGKHNPIRLHSFQSAFVAVVAGPSLAHSLTL